MNRAYEKRSYAEIPLLKAKCREAIASAYHHWQSGSLAHEQSLTESQKRDYFVALLRSEAGMQSLDFLDREADFEGNEGVRDWLRSDSGKKISVMFMSLRMTHLLIVLINLLELLVI